MSWNPDTYLAFADHRTRPAAELLARIPLEAPARVADLGCGPGNSTALLAARWPDARIDGIDSSPEMIRKAKASGIAAGFSVADIAAWSPAAPVDVIFANAALQWLDAHDDLFPRLMAFLAPGGVLAVQMPRNFAAPSHVLLRETVEETGDAALAARLRPDPVATPETYHRLLAPHAAASDIWTTTYLQVLLGEDPVLAWVSGTALVPFTDLLEGTARTAFVGRYAARLRAAYPRERSGETLFPFERLFIVATRA